MGKKVLVVDDERDCLEIASISLRLFGDWEVFQADNVELGLQKAMDLKPDIVLLDYYIDDMTGGEFLTKLRAIKDLDDIPVVVYSGSPDAARKDPALVGRVEILAKPLNPDSLSDTLKRIMGEHQA